MATVELEDVAKSYGGRPAVMGLSLSVASGESVALLGPSGCGKTTTLNMIAGFIDPDRGALRIGGRSMTGVPPYRRSIGVVFQSYALFPHLDVFDNLAFGLRMHGETKAAIAAGVRQGLDLVQLAGLERRYPRELSGGQQQRVALARALVWRPSVLLLDEPLSNLDAKLRQEMRVEIVELQKRLGITMIFVTHDQEEALTVAARIAVMNAGEIEQVDAPTAIYARPRTEFVARFIGEGNFVAGRVRGTAGGRTEVEGDDRLRLFAADGGALPDGARVLLMVRPEKVRLRAQPSGDAENSLPVTVEGVSFLGAVTRYRLSSGPARLTASIHDGDLAGPAEIGRALFAEWRAADCLLLDETRGDSRGEPAPGDLGGRRA